MTNSLTHLFYDFLKTAGPFMKITFTRIRKP